MANIIHPLKEKPSVWWSDITLGRQIRPLILCFCPVRGFSVINPPYIFPRLQLFVGNWCRVIHSNKQRDYSSSPFNTPQTFLSLWRFSCRWTWAVGLGCHRLCKDPANKRSKWRLIHWETLDQRLFISLMLEWQQLYPQCVPISTSKQWETVLEQVRQRDQEGLPAAHTKPVFSW